MTLLPLILLALVQGLTEFIPVSSSGHLVVLHALLDKTKDMEADRILDVSGHVGTLLAVLVYFRKDVGEMLRAALGWLKGNFKNAGSRLNFNVLVASLPVIIIGLILHELKPAFLAMVEVMAWSTVIFGVLLFVADMKGSTHKTLKDMNIKDALVVGLFQAIALIPGTSRSGITMTAARFLGYSRTESAHFSFLMVIVAVLGAAGLTGIDLIQSKDASLGMDAFIMAGLSFLVGWGAIAFMMKWLRTYSFAGFAVYRILLGGVLLILIYSGAWTF